MPLTPRELLTENQQILLKTTLDRITPPITPPVSPSSPKKQISFFEPELLTENQQILLKTTLGRITPPTPPTPPITPPVSPSSPKKQISFFEKVRVRPIPTTEALSRAGLTRDLWYGPYDFSFFNTEAATELRACIEQQKHEGKIITPEEAMHRLYQPEAADISHPGTENPTLTQQAYT